MECAKVPDAFKTYQGKEFPGRHRGGVLFTTEEGQDTRQYVEGIPSADISRKKNRHEARAGGSGQTKEGFSLGNSRNGSFWEGVRNRSKAGKGEKGEQPTEQTWS